MANLEDELKDLREKNNELVQKVQYWKMTAAQRENEKLDLMKEINDLRLKLSRLRSGGAAHARKLDAALQSSSEEALSHLVQASSAVARTLELAKNYMHERQELDSALPRWSTLSNTPSREKVNRVPPMLIGGRLMQPVVTLSRTLQSGSRSVNRSPNQQNRSASERPLPMPMHMLQDVYIPLTRIDAGDLPVNNEADMEVNQDDSTEDLALDDSDRIMEESQNISGDENFDNSRGLGLDAVIEDLEPEEDETPPRPRTDNPLEGPSWLLDEPRTERKSKSLTNFEPDSTTGFEDNETETTPGPSRSSRCLERARESLRCEFTPTVRRRRASPPPPASAPRQRRISNNGRILKVLVAKMRLDDDANADVSPPKRPNLTTSPILKIHPKTDKRPESSPKRPSIDESPKYQVREMSPSKRLMRFDAPSPNGSTDSRVIVLENQPEPCSSGISNSATNRNDNRNRRPSNNSNDNRNSQSSNQNNDSHNRSTTDRDSLTNDDLITNNTDNNRPLSDNQENNSNNKNNTNSRSTSHSQDPNSRNHSQDNRSASHSRENFNSMDKRSTSQSRDSRDSDSSGSEMASETRTRRPRKAIVYKEKPLNRKLRR